MSYYKETRRAAQNEQAVYLAASRRASARRDNRLIAAIDPTQVIDVILIWDVQPSSGSWRADNRALCP